MKKSNKGITMPKKQKMTERERLINSLEISVFVQACDGIKTETLKKIKELIEADQRAYYYDGGE